MVEDSCLSQYTLCEKKATMLRLRGTQQPGVAHDSTLQAPEKLQRGSLTRACIGAVHHCHESSPQAPASQGRIWHKDCESVRVVKRISLDATPPQYLTAYHPMCEWFVGRCCCACVCVLVLYFIQILLVISLSASSFCLNVNKWF